MFASLGILILFLLAGFEVDFRKVRGRPIQLAVAGWFASVAVALMVGALLERSGMVLFGSVVGLAMTMTAMGTLMPILRDAQELETPFGRYAIAAAALGEFGPEYALIGLVFEEGGPLRVAGVMVLFVALSVGAAVLASRVQPPRIVEAFRRMMNTSAQLPLRASLFALGALVFLSRNLGLDTVVGAVSAGMIVSLATPDNQRDVLVHKLEGLGFGFFIPIFFVVSGMRFDLTSLVATPAGLFRVPLFLALFLVVRGLPALLYRRALPASDLPVLALLSATELPVVITTIAVAAGHMRSEDAAALVGAGMVSVFVFPLLALRFRRVRREAPA